MKISRVTIKKFVGVVREFAVLHMRDLPWRQTDDAYAILVSEIMLQQTQVERVVPKYLAFITRFPTIAELAKARQDVVLKLWKGLGYNRRALALHRLAKVVVADYGGALPADETLLKELPGIGSYTARAVLAFAFNVALPFIETNIRTVYLYHFFQKRVDVSDGEILEIIEQTLDRTNPRQWYYALMDYGSHLKRTVGNLNVQSKHYTKQPKFAGSDRQVRGKILEFLLYNKKATQEELLEYFASEDGDRIVRIVNDLIVEGFVMKRKNKFLLQQ